MDKFVSFLRVCGLVVSGRVYGMLRVEIFEARRFSAGQSPVCVKQGCRYRSRDHLVLVGPPVIALNNLPQAEAVSVNSEGSKHVLDPLSGISEDQPSESCSCGNVSRAC